MPVGNPCFLFFFEAIPGALGVVRIPVCRQDSLRSRYGIPPFFLDQDQSVRQPGISPVSYHRIWHSLFRARKLGHALYDALHQARRRRAPGAWTWSRAGRRGFRDANLSRELAWLLLQTAPESTEPTRLLSGGDGASSSCCLVCSDSVRFITDAHPSSRSQLS